MSLAPDAMSRYDARCATGSQTVNDSRLATTPVTDGYVEIVESLSSIRQSLFLHPDATS